MQSPIQIDVSMLDAPHRRALEDVLGRSLSVRDRLVVQVNSLPSEAAKTGKEVLELLNRFYDGVSDEEVEEIDRAIRLRANFTRPLP